jgi:hypothetical protein
MMEDTSSHGAFYHRPTFAERFWPSLGFRHAHAPSHDEDELGAGWVAGVFIVETYVSLDWFDRIRVLISGKLHIEQAVLADVVIGESRATSAFGILPPNTQLGAP